MTGGRLLKVKKYLNIESFCFTYGDGLSNVDIKELIENHEQSNTLATLQLFNLEDVLACFH